MLSFISAGESPEKVRRGANLNLVHTIIDRMAEDGFNATTDMPACVIYRELLDRYPTARVDGQGARGTGRPCCATVWAEEASEGPEGPRSEEGPRAEARYYSNYTTLPIS